MRTNYVLIDFENVMPDALEHLSDEHFKIVVFVGANQAKLPFEIANFMQRLGRRAEYIKVSGGGRDALDFHIAYYIGRFAASDPSAYFHIISKDTGFDPLVRHLKSQNIYAGRVKAIAEIPLVKVTTTQSPIERVEVVVKRLRQLKASKPRTVKTLSSTIASLFHKQLAEEEIADLVQKLASAGYLSVSGAKVAYALPEG